MQTLIKSILVFLLFNSTALIASSKKAASYIAMSGMSMDYREYNPQGDILDSEKSAFNEMIGYELGYRYYFSQEDASYSLVDACFTYFGGRTDYTGAYLGAGLPYGSVNQTTTNDILDAKAIYKRYENFKSGHYLIYGAILGYKAWHRQLSASQEELYRWLYLGALGGYKFFILKDFSLEGVVDFQYALAPVMDTNFGIDFDLGRTYSGAAKLKFSYEYSQNITWYAGYTYERQIINASEIKAVGANLMYEPDSIANNQYIKFGISLNY